MNSELDTTEDISEPGDTAESSEAQETKRVLDLDVEVTSPSACQRHVRVSVSRTDIDQYFMEEFDKLMPTAQVPGFRAGRAPRKLVEGHFRKDVTPQIKGRLLLDCISQVSEQQAFTAIGEPDFDFDAIDIPPDGPFTFEFDLEVRPEFDLPEWKGLRLERPVSTIDNAAIDAHLERILENYAVAEPVAEAARANDFLVLNIQFFHEGKRVRVAEELTARIRPSLSFRDGNLEGFDKLMIGARAGDRRSAKVLLTKDAESVDLRGETVDLEIEVLEVKRLVLPTLDAELIRKLGNFDNEGDLRDAVKGELERQLTYRQNERLRQQITDLLTESANWELPPELLRRQSHRELERAVMELRASGFGEEQIQSHVNFLRQNSQKTTAKAMKEHFILERIAEQNKIDVDENDYEVEIELMALQSRETPRSVRAHIEKKGLWDALRNHIVERKVIHLIRENARFTDVSLKTEPLNTSAVNFAIGRSANPEIPDAKHGGDEQELRVPTERA
jgi:trigger factor